MSKLPVFQFSLIIPNTEEPQKFFRERERCRESGLESKRGASAFHVRAKESAESEMTV